MDAVNRYSEGEVARGEAATAEAAAEDATTSRSARAETAAERFRRWPMLPAESPLEMPIQSLASRPDRTGDDDRVRTEPSVPSAPGEVRPVHAASMAGRRFVLLACTLLLSAFGAHEMYLVLQVAGVTPLEYLILALFVLLFAWIAFSFVSTLAGFLAILAGGRWRDDDPGRESGHAGVALPRVSSRTALLFPVYNEDAGDVMARLQAMHEALSVLGALDRFDFFVLSDTTQPDVWLAEEDAFLRVREATDGHARIFYRHRRPNTGRKAGNIADWVRRFGGRYEHMIVLDADSLMSGETLIRLADAMERHPKTGLLQTLPVIVNATTLFARLQQFANRLYGPLIAHGIGWWHGSESNYWGHNAIIRTRAFAEQAGLPRLNGRKPIGGEIMSHDFVEAALMRRGGWAIRFEPGLGGSYEEAPPALTDYAVRDRRWCQGNLQHLGVLPARGLHPLSRLHLLTGIGAYVTAPLWLSFLLIGILIALQAQYIRPEYFPEGLALFPQWPAQDPVRAAWVFVGTMGLLVLPKLLAFVAMLWRGQDRRGFGGAIRCLASVLLETLISGLMAPVMMLEQSRTVIAALAGRDAGWNVQRRDDGAIPWSQLARAYAGHTLFGIALAVAAYAVSWALFLWMSPVILGLLLAIPLAGLTADAGIGRGLRRLGLLLVPEERQPPAILSRANELAADYDEALPECDALSRLSRDPQLAAAHASTLVPRARRRGEIDSDLVIGLAKLDDAETPEEARHMLTDKELSAVLSDRRGFAKLADADR